MKTIKVRIPVVCDAQTGEVASHYNENSPPDQQVEDAKEALSHVSDDDNLFVSWVEAEVPVPEHMQDRDAD